MCGIVFTLDLSPSLLSPFPAGSLPELHLGRGVLAIMVVAMFLKLGLRFWCARLAGQSGSMAALARVHLTSAFSSAGAVAAAVAASVWYPSPIIFPRVLAQLAMFLAIARRMVASGLCAQNMVYLAACASASLLPKFPHADGPDSCAAMRLSIVEVDVIPFILRIA